MPRVEEIRYEVTEEFSEETRRRISVELFFGNLLTETEAISEQQQEEINGSGTGGILTARREGI